ncbi:MAG: arylsulfotransferase family protein [Mycobacteriaceae bacterium]
MGRLRWGIPLSAVPVLAVGLLPALASAAPSAPAAPFAVAFPAPGDGYAAAGDDITLQGVEVGQVAGLTVTGAASGVHAGTLSALGTKRGVTFNAAGDFTPGEKVTVRVPGVSVQNASGDLYTFTVATPGPPIDPNTLADGGTGTVKPQARAAAALSCTATAQQYISRPDLGAVPGACTTGPDATAPSDPANATADKLFAAAAGPAIYDRSGQLVWYGNTGPSPLFGNFQVVNLHGEDLLAYYDGVPSPLFGSGQGEFPLLDTHYNLVHTVRAANGYRADLHEMQLTPQGTALIGSYVTVNTLGGPIIDYVVQEVEIDTGNKVFEWHALDHISTADSHFFRLPGLPWDWFHGNSVQQTADGNLLVSARHTLAAYKINKTGINGNTGDLIWTLGGNHTNFNPIGTGLGVDPTEAYPFCWQHDARELPDGSYTVFDNAQTIGIPQPCGKNGDGNSRGLQMNLTPPTGTTMGTAVITDVYRHDPNVSAGAAGNVQALPDGSRFLGFGQVPEATLYAPDNTPRLEVGLIGPSYRAFTFPWKGTPSEPPTVVVKDGSAYASWNGATQVSSWQVLTGPNADDLVKDGGRQPRTGFETQLSLSNSAAPVVRVQALDADGNILGTSVTPVSGSTHLQLPNATAQFTSGYLSVRATTPATGGVNVTGADLALSPVNADYSLLFGLIPLRATISLTPVDPTLGRTIPLTGTFAVGGSTATFTANVHLDDFSAFGISLQGYFGTKCASMPVTFTTTSSGDARLGSELTGTYTIPPFAGCDGVESVVSSLLSAPGNTISLKLD